MNNETDQMPPDDCEIVDEGRALKLSWAGNRTHLLEASFLWGNCPSAAGRRRPMDGIYQPQISDLRISKLNRIGHYAVNIGFCDGHDRGVYPWSLLADFADRPTMNDFISAPAAAIGDDAAPTPKNSTST